MRVEYEGYGIKYEVSGSGEHVTLVHGVGSSLRSWDPIVARLGNGYRILRYDTRGHGASEKPPGPYSLNDYVGELRALLDAERVETTQLVGISFGGMIVQAFASRVPERVSKLVIMSAVAGRTADERAAVIQRAEQLASGGATLTIDASIERWFTPEFRANNPEIIKQHIENVMRNDPAGYAAAYRVFAESDLVDELHKIRCPTLIVTGEHDINSNPQMARRMHELIPESTVRILPNLRHDILMEAPDEVANLLREFLSPEPVVTKRADGGE
jgi:(E)-2-((N-methylformamido)methylene)succinate hydrolase